MTGNQSREYDNSYSYDFHFNGIIYTEEYITKITRDENQKTIFAQSSVRKYLDSKSSTIVDK